MPLFRPRWIIPFSLFWIVFVLIAFSDTAADILVVLISIGVFGVWGVSWLVRVLILLSRFILDRSKHQQPSVSPHKAPLRHLLYLGIEPAAIALSLALILFNIPLSLRFKLSEAALTHYVQEVQAGRQSQQKPGEPARWVGLFAVKETELLDGGIVRLITAEDFVDHAGLVYSPQQPPIVGEDSYTPLYGVWWHWHRSW